MTPATKTHSRTTLVRTSFSRTSRSLRSAARLGLGLLSLLSLSAGHAAYAAPVNWDGTTADWFSNPAHWVGGKYPGAGDDAINMSTAAMTLGQSTTINSFFSNGAFTLQGGTFSGNQANSASTLTVNNVFTDNGGGISNFTVNQGTGGSVVFTTSGGNSLSGDIFNAAVDLSSASAYVRLFNTNTFNNQVSLGASGGNGIHLYDTNTNFVIGPKGTLSGFGGVMQDNGGATLTNNGTINANSSGNTLNLALSNFNNAGTAEATNGATLTLNNTFTNAASGSKLSAIGTGSVISLAGTFTGTGNNAITASNGGQVQVNGATLLGTINTDANTALVFNTNGGNTLNGTTVNGNLDLSSPTAYVRLFGVDTVNGNISLGASGGNGIHLFDTNTNLVIGANGSLTGFGGVVQDNGGATLTNNGTVNANSTGSTLNLALSNFNNANTTEATNGGTLTLNNTTTNNSGILAATGGGVLDISGTLNSNTGNSINGVGGTVNVMGATLLGTINETTGTSLVFDTNGGNNLNNTTVNGNLDLSNSTAYVRLFNTDTVNGNVNLGASGGNGIHLYDTNTNLVLNGTLFGFGGVMQDNGGATLTNNGLIDATSTANPLNLALSNFNNTGTAEATNGGVLALNNTTTNNTGILAAAKSGILDISGTLNSNTGNSINGVGGTVNVMGATLLGTVNETTGTSLVFDTNGGNNLNGTTVNGNLDLSNSVAYVRLFGADTVNGNIALGASGGDGIHLYDTNTSLTLNGTLSGFGGVVQDNGGATLTNNGLIDATSTANPLNLALSNFNNNGTTEATNGATLTLNNTNTNAASGSKLSAIGTGSVISLAGTFTGTGNNAITASNGGQVQVNGATLLGTINTDANTALVFNTNGGNTLNGTTVNGNLDLSGPTAYVRMFGADTVNGNIALGASGGNGIHLFDTNTKLVVGANGTLSGFGGVVQDNGGATLTNNGLVNANSAGNTLNINTTAFNNTGTVQVLNGAALSVTSANTDSGNILVKKGGTATFTQGVTQTAGLTQADGTLNSAVALTGGTLSGSGTVNGDVTNSGGTVAAGSPFGTLAVNGAFSQTAGGTLDAVFSNTQSSLLAVSGAVTTGGFLSVNYLGAGPFTAGNAPFTFLDYGTLTSSITGAGPTQYFANETFDTSGNGLIAGQNGFLYALINNTGIKGLQLSVVTNGAPTPAVPEASTTISFGLLLALGGLVVMVKRKKTDAAA